MAMKDEDKAELKGLFAEAFADGLALFRSKQEEEAAKSQKEENKEGEAGDGNNSGQGFSFAGFLLGGK